MNTLAVRSLRRKLAEDKAVHGLWITLETPSVTEMAVGLGLDWVVIDAEHGAMDWAEIVGHLRATVRSETVALVRIAELDRGLIKRALDLGADGVVIPWVETEEQARRAVSFARYPPEGCRGIGAERATGWGECFVEHTAEANDHVLVVPIVESVRAFAEVPAICRVDGVEIVFFGPADFSASAGFRGQWEGPGVAARIDSMKTTIRAAGKHCGVVATGVPNLTERFDQGFRVIALGLDSGLLLRSLHESLGAIGRDRKIQSGFLIDDRPIKPAPLARPPESMRPDRPEVTTKVGAGLVTEIASGVRFECLVGPQNHANGLTTGIVTFEPMASVPYRRYACDGSITLLEGIGAVEVEGRRYELGVLDNVVVPRGVPHRFENLAADRKATFHVARAGDDPMPIPARDYPRSDSLKGPERVNRFETAHRFEAGPNTEFIDFFNETIMPGISMSGGYGRFAPGGRLPAHVHDFDESICIIEGDATCVVEGRSFVMRDCATALQPRGRVHYFINKSDAPMAMLWVYAGPAPIRIVVDERCATVEGDPWRVGATS